MSQKRRIQLQDRDKRDGNHMTTNDDDKENSYSEVEGKGGAPFL